MKRKTRILLAVVALVCVAGIVFAQQRGFGGRRGRRQIDLTERNGVPEWDVDPAFKKDVFTFVRIRYSSDGGYRGGYGGWGGDRWLIDFPDSDLNFSYRLQQLTSLKVDPKGKILELTDDELFDYPFIYIVEPGRLHFSDEERACLRRYLLNGGFLMVDDFWGEAEGDNWYEEIAQVLPEPQYQPERLTIKHPIFHCVYDLKELPQIPAIQIAIANKGTGITWERPDAKEPDYRAIFDDKGRMMVMICHNTDNGDGWEREGEDEWYFREFSEKKAYPLGINIIYWAMTH
jgi:hypothetical protein